LQYQVAFNRYGPAYREKDFLLFEVWYRIHPSNQLVRKANKFEVPEGPNKEMLTATPNENPKAFSSQYIDKQQNLSPLFKSLEQRGFKFTYYEEH
jgi:hypothetical protein